MAQHVYDSSLFERRLRPIYDSLEVGNNKKALQEVDKLLKKIPGLTCARALKALALLRLGRENESNTLLNALAEERPSDDATLQVLTFCYKEMEQLEKICEIYQHAAKQSPGNEEILAHLFIAYVRLNDYKSQQATALQLYKVKPKNPYYFWAVMSVILQGIRGPESSNPDKRKIYLALAQRMVDKLINEDKIDAEQEIQIYLNILEEQLKFKEALEFLDGPICQKFYPGAPISIKINLLKKLKQWNVLSELLENLLREQQDRWDYYQEYISTCFELINLESEYDNSNADKNDSKIFSLLEHCQDFIYELAESGKRTRGPYLARLELYRKMMGNGINAERLLGDHSSLILEYFRFFGDKPCSTNDIALFLKDIEENDRKEISSKLLKESGSLPTDREQMQKHICALQLSRICGFHLESDNEHLTTLYTALKLHYEHGLSTFGKNLLPTDFGSSDSYALLAAHIMYDLTIKEGQAKYLMEALCFLSYVLQNSPNNFHIKLVCLKIYHFFGCGLGAQEMYESLDIKHIQLDSMGYLHCLLMPATALTSITRNVYDSTLKFFTTSYKERIEYIAMSYKYGSFSKLQEFMDFRDKLSNSLHYAMISTEELILEIVCLNGTVQQNINAYKVMGINAAEDRISWDQLSDNRDLSVVASWNPIHLHDVNEIAKESFEQDIEALRIRLLMLRMIASFIDLFYFPNRIKIENSTDVVESLRDSWNTLFKTIRSKNYKRVSNQFLVSLLPSHLHTLLNMPYEEFFNQLAELILSLYSGNDKLKLDEMNEIVTKVSSICCETINEYNDADDKIWIRRLVQTKVYSCVEILSLYALVLSICYEKISTSSANNLNKKNKKKDSKELNSSVPVSGTHIYDKDKLTIITGLMKELKREFQDCKNAIAIWKSPQFHDNLAECLAGMSLTPKVENDVVNNVIGIFKENHLTVVRDLRNIIKDKIRMVNK